MLVDLGKIIGGPDEGDGLIGWFLGLFAIGGAAAGSGVFDEVGGASLADVGASATEAASSFGEAAAGFGRGAASEGWFSRFFMDATFTDYYFMFDAINGGFQRKAKQTMEMLSEGARDVAKAYGLFLQQLKANGLDELAQKYAALGSALPDEQLLKEAHRQLSVKLHPDRNPHGAEMLSALNNARDLLDAKKSAQKITEYTDALHTHKTAIEEFLQKFGEAKDDIWKHYENAHREKMIKEGRLIEGGAGAEQGAESKVKWFSQLHPNQKAGIIFGAVAAVGAGAYLGAKWAEKRRNKRPEQDALMSEAPLPLLHTQKVNETLFEHHAPAAGMRGR